MVTPYHKWSPYSINVSGNGLGMRLNLRPSQQLYKHEFGGSCARSLSIVVYSRFQILDVATCANWLAMTPHRYFQLVHVVPRLNPSITQGSGFILTLYSQAGRPLVPVRSAGHSLRIIYRVGPSAARWDHNI